MNLLEKDINIELCHSVSSQDLICYLTRQQLIAKIIMLRNYLGLKRIHRMGYVLYNYIVCAAYHLALLLILKKHKKTINEHMAHRDNKPSSVDIYYCCTSRRVQAVIRALLAAHSS